MKRTITTLLLGICGLFTALAQAPSALNIDQIMLGDRFTGFSPENVFWGEDNKTIYFNWNPTMDTLAALYKVILPTGKPEKVSLEEQRNLIGGGVYSRDFSRKVFSRSGDVFLLEVATGKVQQITNTLDNEGSPRFTGDEKGLTWVSNNNLYLWDSATGSITQLTNFKGGQATRPAAKPLEYEEWLKEDQMDMFEVLRWRKGQRDARERQTKALQVKRPKEINYGTKFLSGLQASPDLRFVTFRYTKRAESKSTDVPNYVTESGYTTDLTARSKVGTPQDTYEFGIYDRNRDTFYMVDTKKLEGIYDKPTFLKDYHKGDKPYNPKYDKPREVSIGGSVFSDDGKAVVSIRALDNKDRWIVLLDLVTGQMKQLDRQHDEAWIGGGGMGWLPDNEHLWFQSEATGYSHLYTINVNTGVKKALTNGSFEVLETNLSRDGKTFYLTASAEGPHERHFYRLPIAGGKLEKITTLKGGNEVSLSPDESTLAIRYSYSNQPWELYWMPNRSGAAPLQLTTSTSAAFKTYPWRTPEIVWFTARDGVKVPARLYKPNKAAPSRPAVIFVHGAGYLQNVHHWWSSYSREYMFHNFLADRGYTVLDIDYRGSAGYGRDWRTGIYRHMGGKDLDDHVDGAKYLVSTHKVNPQNIGIYGGSYGGFITLMAMFTAPETFKSGAGLRSVTDWAHYNHGYTANILNTPVEDSIAYRRSSPIYFAEGLKGNLLMLHGMVDVNVHFQDVVRLSQRLIELKKDKWDLAVFPLEDHGFVEPSSWADEYKRIFKLFEETLK
ncbi:S9 family peptidase [Haliscomenobacter hydrossis]|uniref:Peptidase S9 prolyl oligopeptidase active site domain protein n=2 Tax=Haliscomenobacter TaxID=2349 RepID=F4KVP7_HALH1|nr:prolyl oligopeptidase family serine peptidase [Haliscomenobacter hydrossis]AEE52504.1 peptidase S9 prolyl oligopeptidase active site domain protein [Haliscomenobacter hydrossis DSM 1100]